MARDVYHTTIALPVTEPDLGVTLLRPLSEIRVSVYARGTTNLLTIYQRPTGVTEGPTPEIGSPDPTTNPFRTGVSGDVEFWVDGPKEVDVKIEDTQAPARIATRTYGWNCVPASDLPASILDENNPTITQGMMSPSVVAQWVQIGQVIDWWRPSAAVPIPGGFEIADGHQVPAGQHEFPVAGAINVPDLRNSFILGALPATEDQGRAGSPSVIAPLKPHGQGANQGNAATDAPGIAGSGGSNAARDLTHKHNVPIPSHSHTSYTPDHGHGAGGLYAGSHQHYVSIGSGGEYQGSLGRQTGSGTCAQAGHTHPVVGYDQPSGNLGIGGGTAGCGTLSATTSPATLACDSTAAVWTADPGTDMRPKFVGLLKLIKVRRA